MKVEFTLSIDELYFLFHSRNFPIRLMVGESIFISEFKPILNNNAVVLMDNINTDLNDLEHITDDFIISDIHHNFHKKEGYYMTVTLKEK